MTPSNVTQDREAVFVAYAEIVWGERGRWAYDTWRRLNAHCFDGSLVLAPITFGLTPHGHALGFTSSANSAITLHSSLLEPSSDDPWGLARFVGVDDAGRFDRMKFATDVLLHEMLHQAVFQAGGYGGDSHSSHINSLWIAGVQRISPLIGLSASAEAPKRKRVKGEKDARWTVSPGCMTRMQLSRWPYLVRPPCFYSVGVTL